MNTQTRRKRIEEILHIEGFCNVASLAKLLGASEVTIRNDLSTLEDEGKVTRIHGGAILAQERPRGEYFEERTTVNQEKKVWIARRAAELVDNYDSLLLDASTTAFYMADALKNHRGLTVFTNGIEVAFRLVENRSNKVILIGGLLRPETGSLTGQFGGEMLKNVRAKKAFFSCVGWSPMLELMDGDLFEAQIKKEMVEAAESLFLLVDSSKFERKGVASFAPLDRMSMVITDDQVDPLSLSQLRQSGIPVSICGEHSTRVVKGGEGEKRFRLGFANQSDAQPFSALVRQGLVQAATGAQIELLLADNREDGPTALANAEYFVQEQVDLVVEFNTDVRYGNVIMERLRNAHIPVIAIDIPLPGAIFLGVDNYKAGLMAGELAGAYVEQKWRGQLDLLISLGLPSSGPTPAARIQGQIEGLEKTLALPEEAIIHLDSKNTYAEAHKAVVALLPAIKSAQHIVLMGINDEVVLGALAAFEEAGASKRVIAVGQGADQQAVQELRRSGSRMIGAVTSFPEYYGMLIIETVSRVLQGKQVPPAVYTHHVLILAEGAPVTLDLTRLPYEKYAVSHYESVQLPKLYQSEALEKRGMLSITP
jgi:ribose transport system substrate-binding protein